MDNVNFEHIFDVNDEGIVESGQAPGEPDNVVRKANGDVSDKSSAATDDLLGKCKIDRPLSRDELQKDYGVKYIDVQTGNQPVEHSVYYGGYLAFSTNEDLTAARLRAAGICKTEDLSGGRDCIQSNYLQYLKANYGLHVITVCSPGRTTFAAYSEKGLIAQTDSLGSLQTKLEAANIRKVKVAPSEQMTLTALPDGKVSIAFPDSAEVILGANDKVVSWRDSEGSTFARSADGPPAEWSNGEDVWKGEPHFQRGVFTFRFAETDKRQSTSTSGDGKTEVMFRAGSFPDTEAAKAIYERGKIARFEDQRGSIAITEGGVRLVSREGVSREIKRREGGRLEENGKLLEGPDAIAFHQRMAGMHQRLGSYKECLSHHEFALAQLERTSQPGDAGLLEYHIALKSLAELVGDNASAKRHEKESAEIQRVQDYNQSRAGACDPIDRSKVIFSQLPDQIGISADRSSLKFSSSDFQKLLRSVPDLRLREGTTVESLRAVSIENDRIRCEGEASLVVPNPQGGADIAINVKDLSADLKCDPSDPTALTLTNIQGLSINVSGLQIEVRELKLKLKGDPSEPSSQELEITVDKFDSPFPILSNQKQKPVSIPLKDAGPAFVNCMQKVLERLAKGDDLRGLVGDLAGTFTDTTVADLFNNVQGVDKQGDKLKITTDGQPRALGGLPLVFDRSVIGKVGSTADGGTEISEIQGITANLNLPGPFAEAIGFGAHPRIEKISLSRALDENKTRLATVFMEGPIKTLELRVGSDLSPVCDADGNFTMTVTTAGGERIEVKLSAGELQAGVSPEDLTFKVIAPRGLSLPGLPPAVGRPVSIEKKGESIRISSPGVAGDLSGIPFKIQGKLLANLVWKNDHFELSKIQGAQFDLPVPPEVASAMGLAPFIRGSVDEISLGAPDKDGKRTLSFKVGSVLESARVSIKVDSNMRPVAVNDRGEVCATIEVGKLGRKVSFEMTFNPQQARTGDKDIDFSLRTTSGGLLSSLDHLLDGDVDPSLKRLLGRAESIAKRGERIEITNAGELSTTSDVGGLPIAFDKTITAAYINQDGRFALQDLQGVSLRLPIPERISALTGLHNPMPVKELSLSAPDPQGQRTATVKFEGALHQVEVKVGADGQPVLDAAGNVIVTITMNEGGKFELAMNEKQIKAADANNTDVRLTNKTPDRSIETTRLHPSLTGLWRGIDSVEKQGEKLNINMKGDLNTTIGGIPVITDKSTSLKLAVDGDRADLSDIEGVKLRLPIPPDVVESLGMVNPLDLSVKNLSIGAADASGNRVVTVKMDGVVEQVELVVGPDMKPVLDESKRVTTKFFLRNNGQQLPMELRFNPEQVSAGSDPRKIDFQLTVKANFENVPGVVEGFFKHPLDPKLQEVLRGVESIERRGDQLFVRRRDSSTHEIAGLKVTAAKEISFKINPDAKGIQLTEIRGIAITQLPGKANEIYERRLPIPLTAFSLSAAGPNGSRLLEIRASGALRRAAVQLDASLTPGDILVEVENPVQALKEKYGFNDGIANATGQGTFRIHISNGQVNMTDLDIAGMLRDAGNFTSTGGVVSAGAAYVADPARGGETILTGFRNSIPKFP
ncbi:MAG: hypothetical protein K2W95_09925 [Candidatus Obscuribacterales bacterium]|nr:hypothetical protein [Candidatus Obscuribacterales bacterium]